MLSDEQKDALGKWFRQAHVADRTRHLIESGRLAELEDWIQRECLFPIGRHEKLPDFMQDGDGETLFPSNLNPRVDLDGWQDAIEIGWDCVEHDFAIGKKDYHQRVDKIAQDDWQAFLDSVETRKKQRQKSEEK